MLKWLRRWRLIPQWFAAQLERLFWPHTWAEWRTLLCGVALTSLGASGYLSYSRMEWVAQEEQTRREQAREIKDLQEDMATMEEELHFTHTRNELLTARQLLEVALHASQERNLPMAASQLDQAIAFLKTFRSEYSGFDTARLDRFKARLALTDVRGAPDQAPDQLQQLTRELDSIMDE